MPKKKKLLSGKSLTKALDHIIRQLFPYMYPEKKCFVCGKPYEAFHPKSNPYGLQVGHYISRSVHPLRWDFKNLEWNCSSCNYIHQGNTLPFTVKIIAKYGKERIDYLNEVFKRSKTLKVTTSEKRDVLVSLQNLLDSYQSK